jgi:hypothetical protein
VPTNDSASHHPSKPEAKLVEPAVVGPALPKISPMNKPIETRAAQPVPGGAAERRPQAATERKPDAAQSLEARVRAALARSNGRTALAGALRRQLQTPSAEPNAVSGFEHRPRPAAVAASPAEAAGSVASAPRAAALSPQPSDIAPQPAEAPAPPIAPNPAPHATQLTDQNSGGQNPDGQNIAGQNPAGQKPGGQNSAIELTPLTTVVVKPQPSIGTDSPQPTPAAVDAQAPHENNGGGPFSDFARMLRSDKPLPDDQAPRPPIAVGE